MEDAIESEKATTIMGIARGEVQATAQISLVLIGEVVGDGRTSGAG